MNAARVPQQEEPQWRLFMSFSCVESRGVLHNSRRLSTISWAASKDSSQKFRYDPPRITSNVKLHLQFLKRLKEKKSGAKPATGFRRKMVEQVLQPTDEEAIWTEENKACDIFEVFEETQPVLLVDGYNVCGYWSKLKKHFKRGHLDYARHLLLEELVAFSTIWGTKVVVVFDAGTSGLPDHKEFFMGIDVVFTASTTADTWIEREVTLLKQDGCPKIWVVTSDNLQQQCAHGSGGFVWSCSYLISQIKDAEKERDGILKKMNRSYSMKGRLLEDNLDPEVCLSLKRLKEQLLEAEPN